MSPESPVEDRVRAVEDKLIVLEARSGLVRLNVATLTLLWFCFMAALSAIIFIVRVDARLRAYVEADEIIHDKVEEHLVAPGHAISVERINELERRVDKLEQKEAQR